MEDATYATTTTAADGSYIFDSLPAGIYQVRISALGFTGTTVSGVSVVNNDTTRNVNATLAPAGAAPTNLTASHSLDSRVVLAWTNPGSAEDRAWECRRASDDGRRP